MKMRWYKVVVVPMLTVGLLLSPLTGISNTSISAAAAKNAESINLMVDGHKVKLSAPIYKENGVAMAPMKDLLDWLDVSSVLEKKSQTLIIRDSNITITMAIGKKKQSLMGKR